MLTILASSDIPAADAWLCGMALRAGVTTCGDATAWVSAAEEKKESSQLCLPAALASHRCDEKMQLFWLRGPALPRGPTVTYMYMHMCKYQPYVR